LRYGKRSRLVDHAGSGGPRNLVTLIGIRYTMGRGDAAIAVDTICRKLGKRCKRPPTHRFPLYGGDVSSFARLVEEVRAAGVPAEAATSVAHNHGAAFPEMLAHADRRRGGMHLLPDSSVLEVEVMHAIRDEMALTLPDIVFRRTDLATGGHPGEAALVRCATIAAHELNWPEQRTRAELAEVRARFPDFAYPQGRNAPKENKN
jgi:glycerol-3-phosphate dehydrogenase